MTERRREERRDVLGLIVGDFEPVRRAMPRHGLLGRELRLIRDAIPRIGPLCRAARQMGAIADGRLHVMHSDGFRRGTSFRSTPTSIEPGDDA